MLSEIKMTMSLATAGVTDALNKAKTGVTNFSSTALEKFGNVAKYASGALVAAFVASAKSALDYGKELSTLADLSNTTVEEFQKLTFGANTVGIENQKLADIFKDVGDKIGDFAQTGGGPLLDFFENIGPAVGVTIEDFQRLSGPEALQLYYDSLSKVNLSQADMTFYMEAIASDATALNPLLEDGGKKWEKYADEMERAGLIMSEEMIEELKRAQLEIDMLKNKTTVETVNMLAAWKLFFKGLGQLWTEVDNILYGLGDVIAGTFTFDEKQLQAGWDRVFDTFSNGYARIKDVIDQQLFDWGIGGVEQIEIPLPEFDDEMMAAYKDGLVDATNAVTEAQRKAAKSREEINKLDAKISAETLKRLALEQTAEEALAAAEKRRLDAMIALQVAGLGGDELKIKEAQLVVAEALTDEAKARKKVKDELAKIDQEIADLLQTSIEWSAKLLVEESLLFEQKRLEKELKEAIARGDIDAAKVTKEAIEIEKEILQIMKDHGVTRGEAVKYVTELRNEEAMLAAEKEAADALEAERKQKIKDMQRELFDAQIAGDDLAIMAAEKKIALEETALSIMDEFKVSYGEAKDMAEDWLRMMAGADLNNSGFTTFFEQREFDRIQAERQDILDDALAAEEREQREQGGNIRNVSEERRDTGSVWERAAAAREQRLRDRENDRLNRIRDPEERAKVLAEIEEARRQREAEQKEEAFNKLNEDRLGPDGKPMDEDGNQLDQDGVLRDPQGKPVDQNGKPIPEPKKPQTLDEVVEKMGEIHKTIKSIDKSLKCEP